MEQRQANFDQERFAHDLQQLRLLMVKMGERARHQVEDACATLLQHDDCLAKQIIHRDPQLDALEHDVDAACIRLLALQHPHAADLRFIVAALKSGHDLERIGGCARDIAKRSLSLEGITGWLRQDMLQTMSSLLNRNIREAVGSLTESNAAAAWAVCQTGFEVDTLHELSSCIILKRLSLKKCDPSAGAHLIHILKGLKRIGDYSTDIAEMAYYVALGVSAPILRARRPIRGCGEATGIGAATVG